VANTHLQTAHEYGVRKALEKCGYASLEEVQRDVEALGLVEPEKTASSHEADKVFASLKTKLG
jgi:hypothetical protein